MCLTDTIIQCTMVYVYKVRGHGRGQLVHSTYLSLTFLPPPHMATNQVSVHSRGQRSDRHGHGSMFLHLYMFLDLYFLTAHNCRT